MSKQALRIWSIILVFVMLLHTLPLQAMAEQLENGTATESNLAGSQQEDINVLGEIVANRSEYIKEFQMSNGLRLAAVYDTAVHFEENGEWMEIDNTLKLSNARSGNVYTNTAGVWNILFPQTLTTSNGISIEKDGYLLQFRMSGELHRSESEDVLMNTEDPSAAINEAEAIEPTEQETLPIEDESLPTVDNTEPAEEPSTSPTEEAAQIEEADDGVSIDAEDTLDSDLENPSAESDTQEEADAEQTNEDIVQTEEDIIQTGEATDAGSEENTSDISDIESDTDITISEEEPFEEILTIISAEDELSLSQPTSEVTAVPVAINTAELYSDVEYPETVVEKGYSQLAYSNVYSNTDIIYELNSNLFKESVVIKQYDSSLYGYTYIMNVGTMIPVLNDNGEIYLYDESGENIIMVMPAPYLVDDNGEYCDDVQVMLQPYDNSYLLSYTLPQAWMAASDRAWPVVLDPAVMPSLSGTNIRDVTLSSGGYRNYIDEYLHCGYSSNLGLSHIYVKYTNLPELTSSDVVVSANMRMYMLESNYSAGKPSPVVEVHKVPFTWQSEDPNFTWSTPNRYNTIVEDYAVLSATGAHYWDVTDIVREWYAGDNTGMMFKLADSAETQQNLNLVFHASDNTNYIASRKPGLTVVFRNNNGLESYWDYTASSAGRAGTGYVNKYTGNLIWTRSDMGFGGNLMPVSISHVYNANDNANNSFGLGYGWRTNYNQRVYLWSVNSSFYVWEDSDGTSHYFKYTGSSGTYADEDGLNLTLTVDSTQAAKYVITDKVGNTSSFDTLGRLISQSNYQRTPSIITISYAGTSNRIIQITDGVGRVYNLSYESDLLNRISYCGKGNSELAHVAFSYDENGDLTKVTDMDGKECNYSYFANHLLSSAQDIDSYKISYTYSTTVPGQPSRVESVSEYDGNTVGGSLEIEYGHNQTTFTDHNGNVEIVQFNSWGNTMSIQDNLGRAQYAGYAINDAITSDGTQTAADSDNNTAKGNQLTLASKLQNTVGNLLGNSSFEGSGSWSSSNSTYATLAVSTSTAYQGNKSLKVTHGSGTVQAGAYGDAFTIVPGETYTFSAYIKSDVAAYLAIGGSAGYKYSETVAANQGWTRVEVSYTNNTVANQTVYPHVLSKGSGTIYLDCVQLEKAPTASRYNLIENGDFRHSGSGWSSSVGRTSVSGKAPAPQLDDNVYEMEGNPTGTNRISQTVNVSGQGGEVFVLAGWGMADSAPLDFNTATARKFGLIATFNYTDGTTETFTIQFNPYVNNWQYAAAPIDADRAYSSITIEVAYDYNVNSAWFDGIQLFKEGFGSTYDYFPNGNLEKETDIQGGVTSYAYDDDNNLTSITLPDGSVTTYEYDEFHNVEIATTKEGVVYTLTYDFYGNNTSVSIGSGDEKITSIVVYTEDNNYPFTSTDAEGNTTTYAYDEDTGVLDSVTDPRSGKTEYTYDNMFRMAQAQMANGTGTLQVNYTYEDDLLKTIITPTTTYTFGYGAFSLRQSINIGSRNLATYEYTDDENNYLEKLAYGNGNVVKYDYDDHGRVTKQTYLPTATSTSGDTVTYRYDNDGDLASVTDSASGITSTYYYDYTERLMKYRETGGEHSLTVAYGYDSVNNLTSQTITVDSASRTMLYTYDDDNRITQVQDGSSVKSYVYDPYGRLTDRNMLYATLLPINQTYEYLDDENGTRSNRVGSLTTTINNTAYQTQTYTYDANGNITQITSGGKTTRYTYDAANQLIREDNQAAGYTWVYTYDVAGNITRKETYSYTLAEGLGSNNPNAITYTYGNRAWGDLLTGYGNYTITSDQIGNPLEVKQGSTVIRSYTWEHGRQLASLTEDGTTWNYTYNSTGLRTERTNGSKTYTYTYNGSQLTYMTVDGHTLWFSYDAHGPMYVKYDGTTYLYVTNLQGDIIAIVNNGGTAVVEYTYDAWGNILYISGSMASSLGAHNPLRYRGYVYDTETTLYYLQSRYYDPEMGRFINADDTSYLGVDGTLLSNNLFAYCSNNPVNKIDKTGKFGLAIGIFIGGSAIIGGLAGAFTAACTGGNILEGMLEGAALGAVAATATIFVPQLVASLVPATMAASTVTSLSVAATFTVSAAGGAIVDYTTQRVSHELSENSHKEFDLNEGRLIKTAFTTGIAGVVPTYGDPGTTVLNSAGSLVIGFDASFFNAAAEIAITHFLK